MIQRNWVQKAQVKDRIRKTAVAMRQVWARKRRFERNWGRRVCLFDRLVWTVIEYGDMRMRRKGGDGESIGKIFTMG